MSFIGDGKYVGDGGDLLQQLWDFLPWKMINKCPGRYIVKHKKSNPVQINGQLITNMSLNILLEGIFGDLAHSFRIYQDLQSSKCMDTINVVVFPDCGGGGMITYCKMNYNNSDVDTGDTLYVHTLNTASGLERKLRGLGLIYILDEQSEQ